MLINANSTKSVFDITFEPEINLEGFQKKIAFYSLETSNSIPNITETNNSFKFDGKLISLPVGTYSFSLIARYLRERTGCRLMAHDATLHSILEVPADIDFDVDNSIAPVLGFTKKKLTAGNHNSENLINITVINTIHVNCDLVASSRNNGKWGHTMYKFYPDVAPGAKIVQRATHMEGQYHTFSDREKLDRLRISITDQDNNPIDFRGELISVAFYLI